MADKVIVVPLIAAISVVQVAPDNVLTDKLETGYTSLVPVPNAKLIEAVEPKPVPEVTVIAPVQPLVS